MCPWVYHCMISMALKKHCRISHQYGEETIHVPGKGWWGGTELRGLWGGMPPGVIGWGFWAVWRADAQIWPGIICEPGHIWIGKRRNPERCNQNPGRNHHAWCGDFRIQQVAGWQSDSGEQGSAVQGKLGVAWEGTWPIPCALAALPGTLIKPHRCQGQNMGKVMRLQSKQCFTRMIKLKVQPVVWECDHGLRPWSHAKHVRQKGPREPVPHWKEKSSSKRPKIKVQPPAAWYFTIYYITYIYYIYIYIHICNIFYHWRRSMVCDQQLYICHDAWPWTCHQRHWGVRPSKPG